MAEQDALGHNEKFPPENPAFPAAHLQGRVEDPPLQW
jgi:hypothetical protein